MWKQGAQCIVVVEIQLVDERYDRWGWRERHNIEVELPVVEHMSHHLQHQEHLCRQLWTVVVDTLSFCECLVEMDKAVATKSPHF